MWRVESKKYHDKNTRDQAKEDLKKSCKKLIQTQTKILWGKINSIRAGFKYELAQFRKEYPSGSPGCDDYKVKSPYFEDLWFLEDQLKKSSSRSNIQKEVSKNVYVFLIFRN